MPLLRYRNRIQRVLLAQRDITWDREQPFDYPLPHHLTLDLTQVSFLGSDRQMSGPYESTNFLQQFHVDLVENGLHQRSQKTAIFWTDTDICISPGGCRILVTREPIPRCLCPTGTPHRMQ